jgi:hypothetical protein
MAGSKDPAGAVQLWQRLRLWLDLAQQVRTQTGSTKASGVHVQKSPVSMRVLQVLCLSHCVGSQHLLLPRLLCYAGCVMVCCAVQATSLSELQQLGMAGLEQEVGSS